MEIKKIISEILKKSVLPYAKAWAVVAILWIFGLLAQAGLEVPQEVQVSVISGVTTFVVWLVPNIPYVNK